MAEVETEQVATGCRNFDLHLLARVTLNVYGGAAAMVAVRVNGRVGCRYGIWPVVQVDV